MCGHPAKLERQIVLLATFLPLLLCKPSSLHQANFFEQGEMDFLIWLWCACNANTGGASSA